MAELNNFKPLNGYILVKPEKAEKESVTKSGFIVQADQSKEIQWGEVVALGDSEGYFNPNGTPFVYSVKVGDKVYYTNRYGSNEIELEGQKYLLMPQADMLGKLVK